MITFFKILGGLIGMVLAGIMVFVFIVILMFYWLIGIPIEIKRSDKLVGTLQWFKYTKL